VSFSTHVADSPTSRIWSIDLIEQGSTSLKTFECEVITGNMQQRGKEKMQNAKLGYNRFLVSVIVSMLIIQIFIVSMPGNWISPVKAASPPTHDTPVLVSSLGTNTTDENLICSNQSTSDDI
jgi:hypothetical protein